jgi:hypothetical protein
MPNKINIENGAPVSSDISPVAPNPLKLGVRLMRNYLFKPGHLKFRIGFLLGIAILVALVIFFVNQMGLYSFNEPIHRYENGVRFDYDDSAKLKRSDIDGADVYLLRYEGREDILPEAPIYFENPGKVFLPAQMVYVDPTGARAPQRTGYFTLFENESGNKYSAEINGNDVELENGFLFDGQNTYVPLEPWVLLLDGQKIEIPALSTLTVYYDLRIEVYPVGDDDKIIVEQTDTGDISAVSERGGYTVDLSRDRLLTKDSESLLFTQPSMLEFIS